MNIVLNYFLKFYFLGSVSIKHNYLHSPNIFVATFPAFN